MNVTLEPISYEEKPILRNLLELCCHDYSEFNCEAIGPYGLFGYRYIDHYWTEPDRFAFFVKAEAELVGFALGRTVEPESGPPHYSIAEFFILRKFRRKGIGATVARNLFDKFSGKWTVGQEAGNLPAQKFWSRVIDKYTQGNFTQSQGPKGPLLEFQNI